MVVHFLALFYFFQLKAVLSADVSTWPGCPSLCGNVSIPYPFGIGANCSINQEFSLTCDTSGPDPRPFSSTNIDVYNISDSQLFSSNLVASNCYNETGWANGYDTSFDLSETPFSFSEANDFFLLGCDDSIDIYGSNPYLNISINCLSSCSDSRDVVSRSCTGRGCCQTSIPSGIKFYNVSVSSMNDHSSVLSFNPCGYAFLGERNGFAFGGLSDLNDTDFVNRTEGHVPVVLEWAIGNLTCRQAQNRSDYACRDNSFCVDASSEGYRCSCNAGYKGNPYLPDGCQDIDECEDPNNSPCERICTNIPGNYSCSCPKGYYGDGLKTGRGCIPYGSEFPITKLALGVGLGTLSLLIGITWIYFSFRRRKLIQLREKFFQQNGGVFLKQQISSAHNGSETTRVFTVEELAKATNSYSDDRIIGRGGYGTVYKGILHDKRVVAIKKSKVMDTSQIEQFINEVVILTRVDHRNVVKLYGCCLEVEVPLLVYEFVANGTLYSHIHDHNSATTWLSWDNRLRIACEAAGALAYLHSSASIPIIHRDVKSTNILIDDNFTAKISDFGASRLVPLDQTQVTTLVQGTLGYLDPEYFHTSQLTDKSDVYSFGVVLAELLTGKMPLCMDRSKEERNLATYFIMSVKENRLFQILEPRIVREASFVQIQEIGELVKRCLSLYSEDRPTMKEVAMKLESLRKSDRQAWDNQHEHGENHQGLLVGNEPSSDLYNQVQSEIDVSSEIYSITTSNQDSGQYSSDTATLLRPENVPR